MASNEHIDFTKASEGFLSSYRFSLEELAAFGYGVKLLRYWRDQGFLIPSSTTGKQHRYRLADLEKAEIRYKESLNVYQVQDTDKKPVREYRKRSSGNSDIRQILEKATKAAKAI